MCLTWSTDCPNIVENVCVQKKQALNVQVVSSSHTHTGSIRLGLPLHTFTANINVASMSAEVLKSVAYVFSWPHTCTFSVTASVDKAGRFVCYCWAVTA